MYEVEVKLPADHGRVRERLETLGAELRGTVEQVDTYYDHPGRSFARTDEAVRVRREAGRAVLTYKGPRVDADSKTRREIEMGVEDGDVANELLQAVGFDPVAEVRKTRKRFAVDGYGVSLDTVEGLGDFVEVEASGDEAAIEPLREGAYDLLDRLGLDPDAQVRTSYLELLIDARE